MSVVMHKQQLWVTAESALMQNVVIVLSFQLLSGVAMFMGFYSPVGIALEYLSYKAQNI